MEDDQRPFREDKVPSGYKLLVSFPDQSSSFAHGFAAGRMWELFKTGAQIEEYIFDEDAEFYAQMAAQNGYSVLFTPAEDEWAFMVASKLP